MKLNPNPDRPPIPELDAVDPDKLVMLGDEEANIWGREAAFYETSLLMKIVADRGYRLSWRELCTNEIIRRAMFELFEVMP